MSQRSTLRHRFLVSACTNDDSAAWACPSSCIGMSSWACPVPRQGGAEAQVRGLCLGLPTLCLTSLGSVVASPNRAEACPGPAHTEC